MSDQQRAGYFRKNLSGNLSYLSYVPSLLPLKQPPELSTELARVIIEAHKMLAILDDRSKMIPDMDLFVSIYVQKEALLSSQIEGTQATLEDVFDPHRDENINLDVSDVVNYVKATHYAIDRLNTLPLCNRLLLETHLVLLSGVRGQEKLPGHFRTSQNWIGGEGSTIKTARYVPPNIEDMLDALSNLEKYMNAEDDTDVLIKAALIHYQFETIHPFLDGNGRIGRLLIILFLIAKKLIRLPALYLSYYLKENRIEYYDRMTAVRESGNYEQWILFFIRGIVISGKSAIETADELIHIKKNDLEKIHNQKYTQRTRETMLKVYAYIQAHPLIDIGKTATDLNLAYNTIASAVKRFEILGILKQTNRQDRNRIYAYEAYLSVLRSGTFNH